MVNNKLVVSAVVFTALTGLLAGCSSPENKPEPTAVVTVDGTDQAQAPEQSIDVVTSQVIEQVPSASEGTTAVDIFPGSPDLEPTPYVNIVLKNSALFTETDFSKVVEIVKANKTDSNRMILSVVDASGNPVDLSVFAQSVAPGMWEPDTTSGGVGIILK